MNSTGSYGKTLQVVIMRLSLSRPPTPGVARGGCKSRLTNSPPLGTIYIASPCILYRDSKTLKIHGQIPSIAQPGVGGD